MRTEPDPKVHGHASHACVACGTAFVGQSLFCRLCGRRSRLRHDSHSGTVLGGIYRIEGKIAEGGFGAIYRVTHLPTGIELALKVLHADFASDPQISARFRRESKTLANLRDSHTVATFERGELRDGTLFIAMELLRGETLLERFEARGPLPWRDVLAIVRATCSSLGEAHARGIVHRDLKPANIHLDDNDFVKVLDFGIAKVEEGSGIDDGDELTFVGQALGTLDYMAPEQLIGATCSPRSDIYALGVIAFELICGRRPFPEATNAPALVTAMLTQAPPLPSSISRVPEVIDQLLLRCLERDPAHRYENVVELARAIDRALEPPRAPSIPRIAQVHAVPELEQFAHGSVVDAQPLPDPSPRLVIYVLGALIGAVGAAIAWVTLS
ncbi:MAG: serine/threonine protein kinase [Myxococcales bacterium]|nr:serine/threonine protein kinase [Myxococcales bacterium]